MKRLILLLSFFTLVACKKNPTAPAPSPTPAEDALRLSFTPDAAGSSAVTSSSTYGFTTNILSTPPSRGVKADLLVTVDATGASFFTQSQTTSSSAQNTVSFSIPGLAQNVLYNVRVTLTSNGTATNTANAQFKLTRK
jgi:hypothetical protein